MPALFINQMEDWRPWNYMSNRLTDLYIMGASEIEFHNSFCLREKCLRASGFYVETLFSAQMSHVLTQVPLAFFSEVKDNWKCYFRLHISHSCS